MPLSSYIAFSKALEAATLAAHRAAAVLRLYDNNRSDLIIDHKCRNDLVSQADREAEQAILTVLRERTPEFDIVAEESGSERHQGVATWYIDPLDGTTNFLHGIPQWAVSIGLVAHQGTVLSAGAAPLTEDTPIVSVVYDPNREELFNAVYDDGCWLNGQRIYTSRTDDFSQAILGTGLPFRDFAFESQYMPALDRAIHQTRGVRRLGSAALDLAWVACGRYDGYWEMGLAPWDVAAGTLLVREAGGIVEDIYGTEPWPMSGHIITTNPSLMPAFKAMLAPSLGSAQASPYL